jgi:hypothetical protein
VTHTFYVAYECICHKLEELTSSDNEVRKFSKSPRIKPPLNVCAVPLKIPISAYYK